MLSTLPSDVVRAIDKMFPWAASGAVPGGGLKLHHAECACLGAIAELAGSIPDYLLTLQGDDFAAYLCSISAIRDAVESYRGSTRWNDGLTSLPMQSLAAFGNAHPICFLRSQLNKCPDTVPAPLTSQLPFFGDAILGSTLRGEVSDVEQSLVNREWRAATVLGGATLEAILFWSIKGMSVEVTGLGSKPSGQLEDWKLRQMIEVARQLGIIEEPTKKLAELARDVRNLVHPGQVLKSRSDCDKATSQTVAAAIEAVVRDITKFCEKHNRHL